MPNEIETLVGILKCRESKTYKSDDISELRERNYLKRHELAKFLGVRTETLKKWENNEAKIPKYVFRVLEGLESKPQDFLSIFAEKNKPIKIEEYQGPIFGEISEDCLRVLLPAERKRCFLPQIVELVLHKGPISKNELLRHLKEKWNPFHLSPAGLEEILKITSHDGFPALLEKEGDRYRAKQNLFFIKEVILTKILKFNRKIPRWAETVTPSKKDIDNMGKYKASLAIEGFKGTHISENRSTISHLFTGDMSKKGVYVLFFKDKSVYVGISIDVSKRFIQHSKRWPKEIIEIAFKPVPTEFSRKKLEKQLIEEFEDAGAILRNVDYTTDNPTANTPEFDLLVPKKHQESFLLKGNKEIPLTKNRVNDEKTRLVTTSNFYDLQDSSYFQDVIEVSRKYITSCLIDPMLTEQSYWNLTASPRSKYGLVNSRKNQLVRLNVGNCEPFSIAKDCNMPSSKSGLFLSMHIATSAIADSFEKATSILKQRFSSSLVTDHYYQSMGKDALNLVLFGKESAMSALNDKLVVDAARKLSLRLMKKHKCKWFDSHCFELADLVFERVDTNK